ncbi:MAG: MarR family winged helix-turn-helix transcriptional regulator [Sneathiellales bacterium]|nr:MarR family winged helix-turn-helix transcriptional regulator [Sneathiellales bacterium]
MNENKAKSTAPALEFRIINWIGIIEQLSSAKARQLLEGTNVPMPQFILLNHFSHRSDEGKTVTGISAAMQQPQPGITKTIAKLVAKGFLKEEPNPEDGRSKLLFLTPAGIEAHQFAGQRLSGSMSGVFDHWKEEDKRQLFTYLDRLKIYLDENR